jgi:hypothetical protein
MPTTPMWMASDSYVLATMAFTNHTLELWRSSALQLVPRNKPIEPARPSGLALQLH